MEYMKLIHRTCLSKYLQYVIPQTTPQELHKVDQVTPDISQVVIDYHSCPANLNGIQSTITFKGDHLWFCKHIVMRLIDGTLIQEVDIRLEDVSRRLYQCEGHLDLESLNGHEWLVLDVGYLQEPIITFTVPVKVNVSFIVLYSIIDHFHYITSCYGNKILK